MSLFLKDNVLFSDERLRFQYDFELNLDNVELVSITRKIYWDFDEIFLTFVTASGRLYHVGADHLAIELRIKLNTEFSIDITQETRSERWDYFDNGYSEILFPKQYKGINLYRRNSSGVKPMLNWLLRQFQIRHIADGVICKEIQEFLDER